MPIEALTSAEAVERLARRLHTGEPYLHPLQIAAQVPVTPEGKDKAEPLGDLVLILGQGDYPTLRHLADEARRLQDEAAATLRALLAQADALRLELAEAASARDQLANSLAQAVSSVLRLEGAREAALREAEEAVQHEIDRAKASPLFRPDDWPVLNAIAGAECGVRAIAALRRPTEEPDLRTLAHDDAAASLRLDGDTYTVSEEGEHGG